MKDSIKSSTNKYKYLLLISLVMVFVLFFLNIILGAGTNLSTFFQNLSNKDSAEYIIFLNIRIPRVIACFFVGAGLSTGGLLLQTMLNNNLASPSIIGINNGAALAVVTISVLIPYSTIASTIATLVGAFLAALLIYLIARKTGASRGKLILAGVAISRLLSALTDTVLHFYPNALANKNLFQLGSFSKVTANQLYITIPLIIIGLVGAILISKNLNVLILGDEVATSLGLNVKVTRFLTLIIVSVLAAASVSIAGLLSFLGLIVPHVVKRIIGVENHTHLVISTILVGASFTMLCDLISRTITMPSELPVGIILALIGIPFFIALIFNKGGKKRVIKNTKLES